jgi:hypothetical protein
VKRRKDVAGDASGCFVRCLIVVVLFFALAPNLLQFAQQAPQLVMNAVASVASSAVSAATNAAKAAINSAMAALAEATCELWVVGGNCAVASAACMSADDAARLALREAYNLTNCAGGRQEFAGWIYEYQDTAKNTCYSHIGPDGGLARSAEPVWDPTRAKHSQPKEFATFHSHPNSPDPKYEGSSSFSAGDLCTFVTQQKPAYVVGTNLGGNGEVRRFKPNGTKFNNNDLWLSDKWLMKKCLMGGTGWCTMVESRWDWTGTAVGTISELPGVRNPGGNCAALGSGSGGAGTVAPPLTEAQVDSILKGCTS